MVAEGMELDQENVMTPRILVVGRSHAGKSTAARILSEYFSVQAGETSASIIDRYCDENGLDRERVCRNKEAYRLELFDYGNRARRENPACWVDDQLARGAQVVAGCRTDVEFAAARGLVDIAIAIDGPRARPNETDRLDLSRADLVLWNDFRTEYAFAEHLTQVVQDWWARPEVYMIGRYRAWKPDGSWDTEAMRANAEDELLFGRRLETLGLRAFCPINIHLPLDTFWPDHSEAARRIIGMGLAHIQRMQPKHFVALREGWDRDPPSQGSTLEYAAARQRHLLPLHEEDGFDTIEMYVEELGVTA